MKEFLQGAVAVAAGVLIAAAVLYGVVQTIQAQARVRFDVAQYECTVNGSIVECVKR